MIRNLFKLPSTVVTIFLLMSCGGRPQQLYSKQVDSGDNLLEASVKDSLPNCTVNVYIENSASMDGYVKGVTEFEQSVYSYISDIKLAGFCDVLNLNYINSKIIKQPDDVEDFIKKLEPSSFKLKGGNRGATDISNLFKSIMEEQGENDIAILISDFVFSPGCKNASEYLTNQQIGIKMQFAKKLKEYPNYSAVLYRLTSRFEGKYYNKFDKPTVINDCRPFFLWILGDKDQLMRLTSSIDKNNIKGRGVDHTYCIFKMSDQPAYSVLSAPRIGTFKIDPADTRSSIISAKVDKKNPKTRFLVSIGVDYKDFLLEDSYLTDPRNYEINNNAYRLEISKNQKKNSTYTHIIKLILDSSQPVISRGNVEVALLKKSAPWGEELTDNDGEDINADGAMGKTFGFKYLIDGVYDAYKTNNKYAIFNLKIK